jgi:hypothetical protein
MVFARHALQSLEENSLVTGVKPGRLRFTAQAGKWSLQLTRLSHLGVLSRAYRLSWPASFLVASFIVKTSSFCRAFISGV